MSPEHLYCRVCPEMDIYSLGVVGWEMLANRPFRDEGIAEPQHLMLTMDDEEVPMLTSEEADPQLADLITSCLQKYAKRRPRADEFAMLLAKCPGHTRNPRVLEQELSPVVGEYRSSGHSQQEFAATPELVATMAVVEHEDPGFTAAEPFDPSAPTDADADAPRFFRRHKNGTDGTSPTRPCLHAVAAEFVEQSGPNDGDLPEGSAPEPDPEPAREFSQQTTAKWRRKFSDQLTIPGLPLTDDGSSSADAPWGE